jgi:hypothetical protein
MKHRRALLVTSSLAALATVSWGADLKPQASESRARTFALKTGQGEQTQISVREALVTGKRADGGRVRGNLVVVFNPATNLFVWDFAAVPDEVKALYQIDEIEARRRLVYADSTRLALFTVTVPPIDVYLREASERAANADDADAKALRRASEQYESMRSDYMYGRRKVSLFKDLGYPFITPEHDVMSSRAKFNSVALIGGNWELVIEGQWKERIVLNDEFKLLGHERVE